LALRAELPLSFELSLEPSSGHHTFSYRRKVLSYSKSLLCSDKRSTTCRSTSVAVAWMQKSDARLNLLLALRAELPLSFELSLEPSPGHHTFSYRRKVPSYSKSLLCSDKRSTTCRSTSVAVAW